MKLLVRFYSVLHSVSFFFLCILILRFDVVKFREKKTKLFIEVLFWSGFKIVSDSCEENKSSSFEKVYCLA